MVILGFALKGLGFAAKVAAMVAAPVLGVLAWGAVEDLADKRKTQSVETRTGV
jgi:hypothetical protein